MKIIINQLLFAIIILALVASFGSCNKDGNAYKDYLKNGEIVYPGRVDTILVYAGNARLKLGVVLGSDPLVKKVRVYWNNQRDSVEVPVLTHNISGPDTVFTIINGLEQGNYNFQANTFDSSGNKSIVAYGTGIVYGANYLGSLSNRSIKSLTQSPDGLSIIIAWGEPSAGELGTSFTYTGAGGTSKNLTVLSTDQTTVLPDFQDNSVVRYQSLYKPEPSAFEFFSPPASTVTLPAYERELSKSKFQLVKLPTDVDEGGFGWLQEYLWDNNYNPPGFATERKIPCWFTIDLGESAALSRFKVWQANDRLYNLESLKSFELYGSNNPGSDGSWSSWTKIGSYTSVKPSGLPVGNNSQADIDFAKAGEVFQVPQDISKFRYYRFKLLTNWGNGSFITMEEVSFFTHDKP